jgi:hypothetical protein
MSIGDPFRMARVALTTPATIVRTPRIVVFMMCYYFDPIFSARKVV